MNMDKENYLTELEEYLDALTADEKADVIEFYNEYIDDAGLETTDEIEKRLGTPRQLSRKVLADYSIKVTDIESHRSKKSKASVRSNGKMIWMILLALLASPAAIVLGIVLFAILACVVAVFGACMVAALAVLCTFFILMIASLYVGIVMLFSSFTTGLFYLGCGLMGLGAVLISFPLLYWIFRAIIQGIANFAKFLYKKIYKNRRQGGNEK